MLLATWYFPKWLIFACSILPTQLKEVLHNDANVLTINYMNIPAKSVLIYYGNLGEAAQKQFSSIYVNVNCYISPRNPLNSDTEVIKVYSPLSRESKAFISAIMASGFTRLPSNFTDGIYHSFLPCPVGTFSNTTSKGKEGCTPCFPGYCYPSAACMSRIIYSLSSEF